MAERSKPSDFPWFRVRALMLKTAESPTFRPFASLPWHIVHRSMVYVHLITFATSAILAAVFMVAYLDGVRSGATGPILPTMGSPEFPDRVFGFLFLSGFTYACSGAYTFVYSRVALDEILRKDSEDNPAGLQLTPEMDKVVELVEKFGTRGLTMFTSTPEGIEAQRRIEEQRRREEESRRREEEERQRRLAEAVRQAELEAEMRRDEMRAKARARKAQEDAARQAWQNGASCGNQSREVAAPHLTEEQKHAMVLGLRGKVTKKDIRRIYVELVKQYHPDKVEALGPKLKDVAEAEMKKINAAWEFFREKYGL